MVPSNKQVNRCEQLYFDKADSKLDMCYWRLLPSIVMSNWQLFSVALPLDPPVHHGCQHTFTDVNIAKIVGTMLKAVE